ncbi:MAG: hypothetical protein K2M53_08695 [Muribaculaceae bacterium]|nr:hypothetical protein [Muribaculaceae bacterium]
MDVSYLPPNEDDVMQESILDEAELKRARDYNAVVKSAKEMGESEGIVKGEEMAKFNMSRNLFKQGVSLKVIAEAAGVTIQKIREWLGIENE